MKKIISMITVFAMVLFFPINIFAQEQSVNSGDNQFENVLNEKEYVTDGPTVVFVRNDDGALDYKLVSTNNQIGSVIPYDYMVDGVIDWAIFHLGFNFDGTLYFTVESDEPLYKVSGNAYVKSTSILSPQTFYNNRFSVLLEGSTSTSRFLSQRINCNGESSVRVGFNDVIITSISGDSIAMANNSKVVKK